MRDKMDIATLTFTTDTHGNHLHFKLVEPTIANYVCVRVMVNDTLAYDREYTADTSIITIMRDVQEAIACLL